MLLHPHITGDYASLKGWDRIPSRGTAVKGVRLYENGVHLGRTVCPPGRRAFEYLIEPGGNSLRIWYAPTEAST